MRSAGRAGPPLPAPPLACTPHGRGPQDGGERTRRPHRGQPLCPPGRGPPTGSPTRSPRHAENVPSRVSAPRHSSEPQPFYLTQQRRTSEPPLSWARVSNGDDEPPAVAALLGREGRAPATPSALAASPRRTPHEAANPNSPFGGFTNPQSASALKARPLQGPGLWEVGASFLLCSDARAN